MSEWEQLLEKRTITVLGFSGGTELIRYMYVYTIYIHTYIKINSHIYRIYI